MQVLENFKQVIKPRKPPAICGVCQKPGWQYVHSKKAIKFRYVYTVHYNEPPIKFVNGIPRYRTCYASGRLYDDMDEMLSDVKKETRGKMVRCPKCNKRGRFGEYINHNKIKRYFVVHEKIEGTWGKEKTVSKRRRCYIRRGPDEELLLRKLGRF